MLITPAEDAENRNQAFIVTGVIVSAVVVLAGTVSPWWLAGLPVAAVVFWWWRRTSRRRLRSIAKEFPPTWEDVLKRHVRFFRALDDPGKERFRNLMKVFIDEVAITGIRTDVDDTTRALVAASAVIPIFGFEDWEYSGLGEVLIYPDTFNEEYKSEDATDRNTLGMIGVNHLSGVMILSKPALLAGFGNQNDRRNVGIHEFAHLVDKQDGSVDGVPGGIPADTFDPWVRWVGRELRSEGESAAGIDDYAYTNEAEYFAVLSEYFFESPTRLQQKNPELFRMLEKMYRQNPKRLFAGTPRRRRRVGRNSPCPCGSGEKYKRCCKP